MASKGWLLLSGSVVLSSLETTVYAFYASRYEKTIDTVDDLDNSGLPYLVAAKTAPHWLVMTDPRPAVRRIAERVEPVPFNGTLPAWVDTR